MDSFSLIKGFYLILVIPMSQSIDQQKSALQILVNGVEMACKRGAYSIAEAASLHQAISVFQTKPDQSISETRRQQVQQQQVQQQQVQQQQLIP